MLNWAAVGEGQATEVSGRGQHHRQPLTHAPPVMFWLPKLSSCACRSARVQLSLSNVSRALFRLFIYQGKVCHQGGHHHSGRG